MDKEEIIKNWPLVGNEHIVNFLSQSLAGGKISGAYILNGPDSLGKTTAAFYFAKNLLCIENKGVPCDKCSSCLQLKKLGHGEESIIHSDLHIIEKVKDKKNISISQVREFINSLSMSSFLGSYKIGIIKEAEALSLEASNALLKTLEEPKQKVVIILITENTNHLPKTIVSRSQVLNFRAVKTETIHDYLVKNYKAPRSLAKNFSRLSLNRPALAVKFFEDKDCYNDYVRRVDVFLSFFSQNTNQKFGEIENLLTIKKDKSVNSLTRLIISTWQGVVRDLLLLNFDQNNLIQHEIKNQELEKIKNKIKINNLLKLNKILEESFVFLRANVSPKLVLENIAINI